MAYALAMTKHWMVIGVVAAGLFAGACKAKNPEHAADHVVQNTADRVPDARVEPVGGLEHGEVCMTGRRDHDPGGGELREEKPCKPGLTCGYPCGIDGCDWVCQTPEEAQLRPPAAADRPTASGTH
jgi:hypothetical protein